MKHIFLFFFTFLFLINVFGQKTEIIGSCNSGLFSFSGLSVSEVTSFNYSDQSKSCYTNNPFGSKNALCYGLSLNLKRVTTKQFIFGFDIGYETLRSKISIDEIDGYNGISSYQYKATGQTYLNINNINFYHFFGYRFWLKAISFDLINGFDIAYILNSTEIGNATTTDGISYSTSVNRNLINFDFRPRIQLIFNYKKLGLYVGYSYGLINYMMQYKGDAINQVFSRLFRFGVTYQIK